MLPICLTTVEAWGFKYITVAFTWVKKTTRDNWHFGCGIWTRANPEICILGKKGAPKRRALNVRNLVISQRREHSRKPDEVRDRIVDLVGDVPRIELFAREATPGWDTWGDEVKWNSTSTETN